MLFYRHLGKVAFVGPVHYAKGTYVGVVMDLAAVGKNDGEPTMFYKVVEFSVNLTCVSPTYLLI